MSTAMDITSFNAQVYEDVCSKWAINWGKQNTRNVPRYSVRNYVICLRLYMLLRGIFNQPTQRYNMHMNQYMFRLLSSMCHFKASCGSTSWYLVTWSLIIIPQSETVHTKCHIMLIFSLVIMPVIVITFVWRSLHRIYWFAVFIYKATRTPKAPGVMLHAILEHYFKQLSHSSVCYRWKEYSVLRHVKNKTEIEK